MGEKQVGRRKNEHMFGDYSTPETVILLNAPSTPRDGYYYHYLHFTGEDTEAQNAELGFVISVDLELGEPTQVTLPLAMVEHTFISKVPGPEAVLYLLRIIVLALPPGL